VARIKAALANRFNGFSPAFVKCPHCRGDGKRQPGDLFGTKYCGVCRKNTSQEHRRGQLTDHSNPERGDPDPWVRRGTRSSSAIDRRPRWGPAWDTTGGTSAPTVHRSPNLRTLRRRRHRHRQGAPAIATRIQFQY